MLVAVAAMASVSCQKEEAAAPETVSATLTMHADVEQTKTYLDLEHNKVLWGKGEAVTLYVGAGETAKFFDSASTDANDGRESASFTFAIEDVAQANSYALGGIYPASAAEGINNNDNPKSYKVALPATQNAEPGKYDPSAYIMVLKPEAVEALPSEYTASFRRAVALNKVTLTGVKENVSSVEITLPEGKYLAGRRYFDLTTGVEGAVYESQTNTIKVNADYTGSSIDVWFTSWGVELAEDDKVTIRMTSDSKLYTRTISVNSNGLKFVEGSLNKLSVNMETAEEEDLDNLAGEYLIAAMPGEWMLMSGVNESSYYSRLESGVTSTALNVLCSDFYKVEDIETCVWTVAKVDGGYSLQNNATRKYLTLTANDNKAHTSDVAVALDITVTDKVAKVVHETYTSRELEYNSSSPRFAFYQNTQKDIYFIPWVEDSTPRISVPSNSIEVAADATSCEFTYELRNVTGIPEVSVDTDVTTMTEVVPSVDGNTVTVTFAANAEDAVKTATIVLSIVGADDVEVVITQAAWQDPSAAQPTSYEYTFGSKQFSNNGTLLLGDLSWTLAGDGGYWGYDSTKGQHLGSGSKPYKSLTLTSEEVSAVSKIKVNTSGGSSVKATLTVTVGGKQIGDSITLTQTATEYTFTSVSPLDGQIELSYTQTSSKAIYIKSISINK